MEKGKPGLSTVYLGNEKLRVLHCNTVVSRLPEEVVWVTRGVPDMAAGIIGLAYDTFACLQSKLRGENGDYLASTRVTFASGVVLSNEDVDATTLCDPKQWP